MFDALFDSTSSFGNLRSLLVVLEIDLKLVNFLLSWDLSYSGVCPTAKKTEQDCKQTVNATVNQRNLRNLNLKHLMVIKLGLTFYDFQIWLKCQKHLTPRSFSKA